MAHTRYGIVGAGPLCTVTMVSTVDEDKKAATTSDGGKLPWAVTVGRSMKYANKRLTNQGAECKLHPIAA